MQIIHEKIKLNGKSNSIKISLGGNDDVLKSDTEITNIIIGEQANLINPLIDNEVVRFKYYNDNVPLLIIFNFYNGATSKYENSFNGTGLVISNLSYLSSMVMNSFFIMDYFDTYKTNEQSKIYSSYLTKIIDVRTGTPIPAYTIGGNNPNQLYYQYIPKSYLNTISDDTVTGYAKFSFYDANNGNIHSFYNEDNIDLITGEKFTFKIELNLKNKTWKMITNPQSVITANNITDNYEYLAKLKNTSESFGNAEQQYPIENVFDYHTGKYITLL